jgi:hypothetical protein
MLLIAEGFLTCIKKGRAAHVAVPKSACQRGLFVVVVFARSPEQHTCQYSDQHA